MLYLIKDETNKWHPDYMYIMYLKLGSSFTGRPDLIEEFYQELPRTTHNLERLARSAKGVERRDLWLHVEHCYQMMMVEAIVHRRPDLTSAYVLKLSDVVTELRKLEYLNKGNKPNQPGRYAQKRA